MVKEYLVSGSYLLQRFAGKGGWTYAEIPEVPSDPHAHFGWVCVHGSIDDYHFDHQRLMPMGNGRLFLPVNAALRKKIGKQAGDRVSITLYPGIIANIPEELESCLSDEPLALERFRSLSPSSQKAHTDRIYSAQKAETRAERIAQLIDRLLHQVPLNGPI